MTTNRCECLIGCFSLLPLCAQQRRGVNDLEEEENDEQSLVVSCIQINNHLIQLIASRASSLASQPPLQGSGSSAHPASPPPSDHDNGSCTSFCPCLLPLSPSLSFSLAFSFSLCVVSSSLWLGAHCACVISCLFVHHACDFFFLFFFLVSHSFYHSFIHWSKCR